MATPRSALAKLRAGADGTLPIHLRPWLAQWNQRVRGIDPKVPLRAVLPPRAMQVWRERGDLQDAFDLATLNGRAELFWWCLLHGFREMGFRFNEQLDGGFRIANEPLPGVNQSSFTPITWLMRSLWAATAARSTGLDKADAQFECIAQYFCHWLYDWNLAALLTDEQARGLVENSPGTDIPRLFSLIWHCDPDLKHKFSGPTSGEYAAWCRGSGAARWPILAHPLIGLAQPVMRAPRAGKIKGINLFGHVLGRFGIGEDTRMAMRTLNEIGIPYVVRNVTAAAAGEEETVAGVPLTNHSPYDVNLFCMTGISTVTATMAEPMGWNDGRRSIGIWPWELPEWPLAWDQAWDCIDEVWATSRFTYDAYCRSARVPVLHMPMAVVAEETAGADRAQFGLPADAFLFGFSFDGLSSIDRKNPLAVISAFRRAFAPHDSSVALVLKGIRGAVDAPGWQQLLGAIGGDPRIHVINKSMARGMLLDLYRTLDAFVSLHRSEGFGRNIAEAMLLGKPVIVSSHSGNMDFTTSETAALVPVSLRTVEQGQYPFGSGQQWGDPDVDAAAELMKQIVADHAWRKAIAGNGQDLIRQRYSPQAVAAAWAERFHSLV